MDYNDDFDSEKTLLTGDNASFGVIGFVYIFLQKFASALLCFCSCCKLDSPPPRNHHKISQLDEAILWARKEKVSWRNLLRYVQIGCQVAVEGFISVFETNDLYKRIASVLSSSGQRVRTFKSLQNYGVILRFGRMLNAIHDLVLADLIEMFPKLFDSLENGAEGDDIVERLHNVQVSVIAELVGPRLTALDHAVVDFMVLILCILCSMVLFIAIYFPQDILVSRWVRYLLGLLVSDNAKIALEGPEDGTSIYRVIIYGILVFFYGSIFFVVTSSMILINVLLSACADIMYDLNSEAVEKIMGTYQDVFKTGVKRDRIKRKYGRTDESLAAESDINGIYKEQTPFRSVIEERVDWLPSAEPEDMKKWWEQLQLDVQHCKNELAGNSTGLLSLLNIGASVLVSFLLVAFSVTEPTVQRIVIGIMLLVSIFFGRFSGHFTSASRSYGIIVLSEVSRHIDAVFNTNQLYKRRIDNCSICVGICCYCCLPPTETKTISLDEWNKSQNISIRIDQSINDVDNNVGLAPRIADKTKKISFDDWKRRKHSMLVDQSTNSYEKELAQPKVGK